jgi:cardiolipin synthase
LGIKRHIPNILTGIRFALIAVYIWIFVNRSYTAAMVIFLSAWATDLLDGYLARKWNAITNAGKLLDPLADKLMLIATLISFYAVGWIHLLIVLIVTVKESLMVLGGILLYKRHVVVYADHLGKLATGMFGIGIVMTFYHDAVYPYHYVVIYAAIAISLLAMIQYGIKNVIIPCRKQKEARLYQKSQDAGDGAGEQA